MAAVPAPPPVFTVRDAMVSCGINDVALFNGDTSAERIAFDVFGDTFATCLDKTFEELDGDFKTYAELTVMQGQIRLTPSIKRNVRAFVQWVRDETRLGRRPQDSPFPANEAPTLLRRYKTHELFIKRSKTIAQKRAHFS